MFQKILYGALALAFTLMVFSFQSANEASYDYLLNVATKNANELHLLRSQSFNDFVEDTIHNVGLQNAYDATVHMMWGDNQGVTTGTIIGCRPDEESGLQEYFILTAGHALWNLIPNDTWAYDVNIIRMMSDCHECIGSEVEVLVNLPSHDVLIASFISEQDLPLVQIPIQDPLDFMEVHDAIYAIGCDIALLPMMRKGILGCRTFADIYNREQTPWINYPEQFFSPSFDAFAGASGGGVYNKFGEYIGMVLAVYRAGNGSPISVYHLPIAIKASTIRDLVEMANVEYVLEEVR